MNSYLKTPFTAMVKPCGANCNLDCSYCYYLPKKKLYPNSKQIMSIDLLEDFTKQYIKSQLTSVIYFNWHGGEPTLMGIEFYKKALEFQKKYAPPGLTIENSMQTNGMLLNREWCRFFKKNNFLIGISIDGPGSFTDANRYTKNGQPVSTKVVKTIKMLQDEQVSFNILCCVNSKNVTKPLQVYRFLKTNLKAQFIQFIPIVTHDNELRTHQGKSLLPESITGLDYGNFLITIYDEWVKQDVGIVFVQIFDSALASWMGKPPGLCVFDDVCGRAVIVEYNGDVYSCDHFVENKFKLGNMSKLSLSSMVNSNQQRNFGADKKTSLPEKCLKCQYLFACNGGCPKNRISDTSGDKYGSNYLCEGYAKFFAHIDEDMQIMRNLLLQHKAPANIMQKYNESNDMQTFQPVSQNALCPCGSKKKYKRCHGKTKIH